jgi:hypothetical protein
MHAIVKAGKPVWVWVTYNVPEDAYKAMDRSKKRTLADRLGISNKQAQVANAMIFGLRATPAAVRGMIPDDVDAYYTKHAAAIDFALSIYQSTSIGLKRVQFAAVIARAYEYGIDPDVLTKFAKVVTDGAAALTVVTAGDRTALLLREVAMSKLRGPGGSTSTCAYLYGVIERALRAFIHNKELQVLRPVPVEEFPLSREAPNAPALEDIEPKRRRKKAA